MHEGGSRIFCQLWAPGRDADPELLDAAGLQYVSASDAQLSTSTRTPRPLTVPVTLHSHALSGFAHRGIQPGEVRMSLRQRCSSYLLIGPSSRADERFHKQDTYGLRAR